MPTRWVAMLRGINVGPRNRVAMADLRQLVEELGHTEVRTHLNSGNVVFTGAHEDAARLARDLTSAIEVRLGLGIGVVVRSRAELAAVVELDPLAAVVTDRSRYLVTFLSARPDHATVAKLRAVDAAPEVLVVDGRELYLWLPDGVRTSKLSAATGRLGTADLVATARNWNTVQRLHALL